MKTSTRNQSLLAALGLASLAVYVLACTSFSPDDSKVLFPAIDAKSGDIGVSVYDRKSGFTEQVFVASVIPSGSKDRTPVLLRPQWISDGKSILVAWGHGERDHVLNFALLPFARRGPTRTFEMELKRDAMEILSNPLAVVGNRLFLIPEPDLLLRLDLETGEVRTNQFSGRNAGLLPSPNGDQILYATESQGQANISEVGWLNPETFARTPLPQFKPEHMQHEGVLAVSPDGKRIAIVTANSNKLEVCVTRAGDTEKRVSQDLPLKQIKLGIACFAPRQDVVYASYANDDETNSCLGLLEIPLGGGPARCTPLLTRLDGIDKEDLMYFQIGLSHDGKTAAVCSTYLALADQPIAKPDDCALFFIDLASPERKVTKVPLPMPKNPEADEKK